MIAAKHALAEYQILLKWLSRHWIPDEPLEAMRWTEHFLKKAVAGVPLQADE